MGRVVGVGGWDGESGEGGRLVSGEGGRMGGWEIGEGGRMGDW